MMTEHTEIRNGLILGENERLDDLECGGYQLIQNTACFCFGMDAVLLSAFAKAGDGDSVLDLGTGNGVIPILMLGRYPAAHYTGLEIQAVSVQLAKRSVQYNHIEDKVCIVQGDLKEASKIFGAGSFDVVTSNPPYIDENHGLINPESQKAVARHELLCTLEDVVREAAGCLKQKGKFYMVHRPQRLVAIFETMRRYKLEPKRMCMVHPFAVKDANMVLVEAVKGGNAQLTVEPPLIIYKPDLSYTDALLKQYGSRGV